MTKIRNWKFMIDACGHLRLVGIITDHPKLGSVLEPATTSVVVEYNLSKRYVKTLNTEYELLAPVVEQK